ncbi:MAG: alpha/beta hydrolase [Clostridiales bacterium]|nr:alpha/beta hydrolase [Clostridiales bacterium]
MKGKAVIFIHGFLGSSAQFRPFIGAAEAAGADAVLLTLPGHGGCLADFCKVGRKEWEAYVREHIATLSAEYDALYLVGHSMGGLLAIRAAIEAPQKIKGILAIGLPLYVRITPRTLRILPRSVMQGETKDPYVLAARRLSGVSGVTVWNSFFLVKNTLALLHMMRDARHELALLPVPLTVINSKRDELLSPRTLAYVKKRLPGAKTQLIADSGHFYFTAGETVRMRNAVVSLIKEETP